MIRRIFFSILVFAVATNCQTQSVYGDYLIRFSDDNGASFNNAFIGTVGGNVTVEAYISQNGGDNLLTNEGLFQFHTIAGMDTTLLGNFSSTTINSDFANTFNNSTATTIDWLADDGVDAEFGDDILLGSFDFNITALGTTTITFGDNSTALDEWITPQFTVMDQLIFGTSETDTFALTISSIPEPSTVALMLMGVMGFALRRKTRRPA